MRPHRRKPTRLPRPWDSPGRNTGVGCHVLLRCMKVKSASEVTQSCPTLSDPMDCSPPGSSVHGIFQARVLQLGATAFSESLDNSSQFHKQLHTAGRDQNLLRRASGFSEALLGQPIMELGFGPGTNQWPHLPPRPAPPRPPSPRL